MRHSKLGANLKSIIVSEVMKLTTFLFAVSAIVGVYLVTAFNLSSWPFTKPVKKRVNVVQKKEVSKSDKATSAYLASKLLMKERQYAKAFVLLKKSAGSGHLPAIKDLALTYYLGRGMPRPDYKQAYTWFQRAMEKGDAWSTAKLGYLYQMGYGTPKDIDQALKLYQQAASQGEKTAMTALGRIYFYGKERPRNLKVAEDWLKSAMEQGSVDAMVEMSHLYNAKGPLYNVSKSNDLLSDAAQKGHMAAQYLFGFRLDKGIGIEANSERAIHYYAQAAKQGHRGAKAALHALRAKLKSEEIRKKYGK